MNILNTNQIQIRTKITTKILAIKVAPAKPTYNWRSLNQLNKYSNIDQLNINSIKFQVQANKLLIQNRKVFITDHVVSRTLTHHFKKLITWLQKEARPARNIDAILTKYSMILMW